MTAAKDAITKVTAHITYRNLSLTINVAFVGYCNFCDSRDRLTSFPFLRDQRTFQAFVVNELAKDGGNSLIDVLSELNEALRLKWFGGMCLFLHMKDYPPHGLQFSNLCDDHPDGRPHKLIYQKLLQEFMEQSIFYYFGRITEHTDKMIQLFEKTLGGLIHSFDLCTGDGFASLLERII